MNEFIILPMWGSPSTGRALLVPWWLFKTSSKIKVKNILFIDIPPAVVSIALPLKMIAMTDTGEWKSDPFYMSLYVINNGHTSSSKINYIVLSWRLLTWVESICRKINIPATLTVTFWKDSKPATPFAIIESFYFSVEEK